MNIKADDISKGKNLHRHHLKQSKLPDFKIFSYGPNKVDATFSTILQFIIYDTNKSKKRKMSKVLNLGLCKKTFVYVVSPGYFRLFLLPSVSFSWHWPGFVTTIKVK